MIGNRWWGGVAAVTGALALSPVAGAPPAPSAGYPLVEQLLSASAPERESAAEALRAGGDRSLVPGIVDALFFISRANRRPAVSALEALTGAARGERYLDWVEWLGAHEEIRPQAGYASFKAKLYSRLDPRYADLLAAAQPSRLRLEEVVWGGVVVEGIPALDRPALVPAGAATYLEDGEGVFGVARNGDARAYPLRILGWHEMLNDTVGGEAVTLSYCTLCGSGVLYAGTLASSERLTFGTSGLLLRSNKLMLDRETGTLWNNLTGEAMLGPLAARGARLAVLPLAVTTWGAWRARHPDTRVLALDAVARRFGYDYRPGAADRARDGVSFPVWKRSDRLDRRAEIFALRYGQWSKAYPLDVVYRERVIHDRLADLDVVVIAESEHGAVRAYASGGRRFAPAGEPGLVTDSAGERWSCDEDGLRRLEGESIALPRLPGHLALWFGWYAFFPDAEVYLGREHAGRATQAGPSELSRAGRGGRAE